MYPKLAVVNVRPLSDFRSDISKKRNVKKTFLRRLPLSRFLAKTLRVNKIAIKSFSKICTLDSTLNCECRHSCIKLTHTT